MKLTTVPYICQVMRVETNLALVYRRLVGVEHGQRHAAWESFIMVALLADRAAEGTQRSWPTNCWDFRLDTY